MKKFRITLPFTKENVEYCNRIDEDVILIAPNTKGLKKDIIKLANANIIFSIQGGLNPKKEKFNKEYYQERTYYSAKELCKIIETFEKIERRINPLWSDLEKAMFVYKCLCDGMQYDECTLAGRDAARNLLGLITRKSVCAGFGITRVLYFDMQEIVVHPFKYKGLQRFVCCIII